MRRWQLAPEIAHRMWLFSQKMTIFVKTSTGNTMTFKVSGDELVRDVKVMVQDKEGVPVEEQRLICGGKLLVDECTLSSHGIRHGSTVHLVVCAPPSEVRPLPCFPHTRAAA